MLLPVWRSNAQPCSAEPLLLPGRSDAQSCVTDDIVDLDPNVTNDIPGLDPIRVPIRSCAERRSTTRTIVFFSIIAEAGSVCHTGRGVVELQLNSNDGSRGSMRKRVYAPLFAVLLAAMLMLPVAADASTGPDLAISLNEGSVAAGNPQLSGQLGVSWENVGSAPATGTIVVTVSLPTSMTTEGALFEATCSPISYEHGSGCESTSQLISPDRHTLTFTFHGSTAPGTGRPLKVYYLPGVRLNELPPGTITASVSYAGDVNPSNNQASLQVGPKLTVQSAPQGSWVGTYGHDGYDLAGWSGSSDYANTPGVSLNLTQGSRFLWTSSTSDVRALQSPDGLTRAAAAYYSATQIQLGLTFAHAYTGNLHLYAVDWSKLGRRETITVGGQTATLSSDFSQGAWVTVPVSVAAGETLPIVVTRTAGLNAVLSGILIGDAGTPPAVETESAPQGSWVGKYGSAGYDLAGWNGTSDLLSIPSATVSLTQGSRFVWTSSTSDVRALQSPNGLTRAATAYYSTTQIQVALTFNSAYTGSLHLYALDWSKLGRRETITVDGETAGLSSDFSNGTWVTFPISVAAGETLPILVTRTAGVNAVLSGIFLD
jgi:hypothetical protein